MRKLHSLLVWIGRDEQFDWNLNNKQYDCICMSRLMSLGAWCLSHHNTYRTLCGNIGRIADQCCLSVVLVLVLWLLNTWSIGNDTAGAWRGLGVGLLVISDNEVDKMITYNQQTCRQSSRAFSGWNLSAVGSWRWLGASSGGLARRAVALSAECLTSYKLNTHLWATSTWVTLSTGSSSHFPPLTTLARSNLAWILASRSLFSAIFFCLVSSYSNIFHGTDNSGSCTSSSSSVPSPQSSQLSSTRSARVSATEIANELVR